MYRARVQFYLRQAEQLFATERQTSDGLQSRRIWRRALASAALALSVAYAARALALLAFDT